MSSESARSTRIFSLAPFADKKREPRNDFRNCQPQAFGTRPLGGFAGARHTRVVGSDRLDRRAGRPAASEAVVMSDHGLLSDHGTYGAAGVLRIPETGAPQFSSLVERASSFLLFCHYDSGPCLLTTW